MSGLQVCYQVMFLCMRDAWCLLVFDALAAKEQTYDLQTTSSNL